ncbi:MAG: type II secretion system F family protein [Sedimentisphaerales bacterium]|jgi:type II secretory pathway component PulF|nr:type II secretion system F family protein [Sedimentisphaerales bacterium]
MAEFVYKAVDRHGTTVTGTIEAVDRKSAVAALAQKGRFVIEVIQKGQQPATSPATTKTKSAATEGSQWTFGRGGITSKDLLAITTQLATALRAGLPLMASLQLLRNQQRKPAVRELLEDLIDAVSSGSSLSEAMSKHPKVFSVLYVSMVRVGETGGMLDQTMMQLAQILGRDEKIRTSIKNASAYPLLVLGLGIVSVTIIVTFILPKVMSTMDLSRSALPLPTQMLLGAGDLAYKAFTRVEGWIFIAGVIAAIAYGIRWLKTDGRLQWDSFKLKIPVLGSVLRTIAVGRFSRTLGALTKGGVTILEALSVVRDTLGNELLAREIDRVAEEVKRGSSIAEPLEKSGHFPPLLVQITAVGEQTGRLDELLLQAADMFDAESDAAITRFMSIFPAILILLLAVVIGFIVVATLLPMLVSQLGAVGR